VNPDPTQHVTWGDQTWEEMAVAFFEIAVPRTHTPELKPEVTAAEADRRSERAQHFTKEFFEKFDSNTDRRIHRSELPLSMERFGFWDWDDDGDGSLTFMEVTRAVQRHADF
jgi:hypothetical protein